MCSSETIMFHEAKPYKDIPYVDQGQSSVYTRDMTVLYSVSTGILGYGNVISSL